MMKKIDFWVIYCISPLVSEQENTMKISNTLNKYIKLLYYIAFKILKLFKFSLRSIQNKYQNRANNEHDELENLILEIRKKFKMKQGNLVKEVREGKS
jgi:hypothetical protein